METRTYNVYTYEEASNELKEIIIDKFRESEYDRGFNWSREYIESLEAFCASTEIKLIDYQLGCSASFSGIKWRYESYKWDFDVDNISGLRLRTWLINNWVNKWEKGKYYHKSWYSKIQTVIDCPFTGFHADYSLIEPILNFIKKPEKHITLRYIINECFDNFANAYCADEEYQYSDEAIINTIIANKYMFNENGEEE